MTAAHRALRFLATRQIFAPLGAPALHVIQYVLGLHAREVVAFNQQPDRQAVSRSIREILTAFGTMTMGVDEGYLLHTAVRATAKVPGDVAEVGVYRGQSALILSRAKGPRTLHLFDTFEGLPVPGHLDTAFHAGDYACSVEEVRRFLKDEAGVEYHPGFFPDSAAAVRNRTFSFVHLDVDLYDSTRAALEFFYPRLCPGGILVSHDYVAAAGVRQAFDEFFANRPEPVVELTGNQCLVVKLARSHQSLSEAAHAP
jgi:predicted O-methyltransferase YrrM